MIHYFLLLLATTTALIQALPRQESDKNVASQELKPLFFIIERPQATPQQQNENKVSARQQTQKLQFGGFPLLEPQFQYSGFHQQNFPRVQPSIYLYGAGGQGQPILINPGSPPGNFLVPQPYPGPNVINRDTPQQRPFFVGGYPNPKPAHIPPIEKDAEEIPTNPARIPPLASKPKNSKPEKLETFNEGKNDDYPFKTAGEADVLAAADKNPQFVNRNALNPGQRFFILNGEDLFQNYPNFQNYPRDPNTGLDYTQQTNSQYPESQILQKQQLPFDINSVLGQTLLVGGPITLPNPSADLNPEQRFRPSPEEQFPPNFTPLDAQTNPQEDFFRAGFQPGTPFGPEGADPVGHFRFTPPNNPYYPIEGEDIENDSITVDAIEDGLKKDGGATDGSQTDSSTDKSPQPGMAQASPGAIALAGPGGVAGASPRATSIVGRGGVAVSNPQATAVAGTKKEGAGEKDRSTKRKVTK